MSTLPDWFNGYARDHFATHLAHLAGQPNLAFLQIGAYTCDATTWLLNHILTSPAVTRFDYDGVHLNAEFAGQASDHDPQIVRIDVSRCRR